MPTSLQASQRSESVSQVDSLSCIDVYKGAITLMGCDVYLM